MISSSTTINRGTVEEKLENHFGTNENKNAERMNSSKMNYKFIAILFMRSSVP